MNVSCNWFQFVFFFGFRISNSMRLLWIVVFQFRYFRRVQFAHRLNDIPSKSIPLCRQMNETNSMDLLRIHYSRTYYHCIVSTQYTNTQIYWKWINTLVRLSLPLSFSLRDFVFFWSKRYICKYICCEIVHIWINSHSVVSVRPVVFGHSIVCVYLSIWDRFMFYVFVFVWKLCANAFAFAHSFRF